MLPVIAGATRVLSVGSKAASAKRALNAVHRLPIKPPLGGPIHWFFGGLMIIADIISIICQLIFSAGIGLTGVTLGVGGVVGLPIAGAAWLVQVLFGSFVWAMSMSYFMAQGVKMSGKMVLAFISNKIPFLSFIPTNSISFISTTFIENRKRKGGGLIGGLVRTIK